MLCKRHATHVKEHSKELYVFIVLHIMHSLRRYLDYTHPEAKVIYRREC